MEIKVDVSQVQRTAKEGPRLLHEKLRKAVTLSTLFVISDVQNRANWEQAPVAPGQSVGRSVRYVRNTTDRLRAVTGFLLRSYTRRVDQRGPGYFVGVVGSPTVYARIHELSGWAGRGHRTFLRARPVLGRAMEAKRATILRLLNAAGAP